MEFKAILSGDSDFTRTKEALKWLWGLRKEIELHEIQIKPYKKDRSTAANAYYWGVVIKTLADHCGYSASEMHIELLGSVCGWKNIRGLDGQERQVPNRSTTSPDKMNTKEFAEYIEKCLVIASDLGVMIEPYERMG